MKRTLRNLTLGAAAMLMGTMSFGQAPDYTIMPDWSVNDINGNPTDLYSHLDAGKPVIVDISATWCGPCWSYHQGNYLKDFYNTYGPSGTDEAMVFFVEGQTGNGIDQLNGITGSTGNAYYDNTQGDWVTGTPYPIIDGSNLGGSSYFDISYFPTIMMVCPNRTTFEIGGLTSAGLYAAIQDCPGAASQANDPALLNYTGDDFTMCASDDVAVEVVLQNAGTSPLTSATIEIFEGSTSIATNNWTGNLNSYDVEFVTVGTVTVDEDKNYDVRITSTNDDITDDEIAVSISSKKTATLADITLEIATDGYGSETTVSIRNENGWNLSPAIAFNGYGNNGNFTENVTLPSYDECFIVRVSDSYGDGGASVTVKDAGTGDVMAMIDGSSYESTAERAVKSALDASITEAELENAVSIYPNPTADQTNVVFSLNDATEVTVDVLNILGEKVSTQFLGKVSGEQRVTLDFTNEPAGMYYVNITAGTNVVTKKVNAVK